MEVTKTCTVCGTDKTSDWYKGPTCQKCYRRKRSIARHKKIFTYNKTCQHCGSDFQSNHHCKKFCTSECHNAYLIQYQRDWRQSSPERQAKYSRKRQEKRLLNKDQSRLKEREYECAPEARFTRAKRGAARRGINWYLSFDEWKHFATQPCFYCDKYKVESGSWLDRIDNNRHYTIDNVLPCCGRDNRIRNTLLTVEETRAAAQAIEALANTQLKENEPELKG